jgi:transketolase N-terminal domain/subunit
VSLAPGDVLSLEVTADSLSATFKVNGVVVTTGSIGAGLAPTGTGIAAGFYSNDTTENSTITQFTATDVE